MSLIEPILPSLRAGLSNSARYITRSQSIPLSPLHAPSRALKRKLTPIFPSTSIAFRPFTYSSTLQSKTEPILPDDEPKEESVPLRQRLARVVSAVMPKSTKEQYYAYQKAEELYKECRLQGEWNPGEPLSGKAKFWYEDCVIVPCLQTWFTISTLHVWFIMVRFRHISPRARAKLWQQNLINHFFFDLEDQLLKRHKVDSSTRRQKYLKLFYGQFRYQTMSYDEAFIRGDTQMAQAIWQNLFFMREDMDFQKIAMVVSYARRILSGLDKLDEETVLNAGVYFGNPADEIDTVERFSEYLKAPEANSSKKR
ncbi:hypothetical protein ABW20_dc0108999 [Dactylellina cionopaga]|nr:hypothetical protein ABW20_dc0108999 [Dactylellina cionopaga]